ncbi:M56 family metallopeptidase [Aeoliella sp.]|uniref:M56 family metallopeptidase n=1 Tax=Aeoliella sp. TaxID=2795800 RepID=UPI003CCC3F41
MNGSFETITMALLRTTLVTSVAATAAVSLLWMLRIRSAKTHRLVWLLVIAQGWLLWPYTWRMEVEPVEAIVVIDESPAEIATSPPLFQAKALPGSRPYPTIDWAVIGLSSAFALWVTGAVVLVLVGLARYARLFVSGRPGEMVTNAEWLSEWNEVRRESKAKSRTELRTTRNTGPLVCWIPWVLLVLVPKSLWVNLARGERLAILRHELAHCERGDLWKNLVVRLLALPQWFNPLVWMAVRRFEEAGEWACDEQVAKSSGGNATDHSATEYARVLLSVADYTTHIPCGAAGMASGVLSRRVKRLLHVPNKEVREMRGFILPVLFVVVGLFQAVRIERVQADEPVAPPAVTPTPSEATHETIRNEWTKQPLPPYVIEPPDILLIDATKLVPKMPHKIEPFDGLLIRAEGVDENHPIQNAYFVDPDGDIDLGPNYGKVHMAGIGLDKADEVVREHLAEKHPKAKMSVSLATAGGAQQVIGEHLVGPDGRVNLGSYGSVYVTGMTLPEAKRALEKHLSKHLEDPEVIVDVFSYNSKKYYIITKGEGFGDNIVTAPITGNDTVLDAIAAIGGLRNSSTAKIFIARPAPQGGAEQILPVEYDAITRGKSSATNYQLLPGDRLFIEYPEPSKPAAPEEASPQPDPTDRYSQPAPPEEVKEKPVSVEEADLPSYYAYERPAAKTETDGADTSIHKAYILVWRTPTRRIQLASALTGPTTVMDVLSPYRELEVDTKVWIERSRENVEEKVVKSVDWNAIAGGNNETNYPIRPGDRVCIEFAVDPGRTPIGFPEPQEEVEEKAIPKLRRTPGGLFKPLKNANSAPPEVAPTPQLRPRPTAEGDQRITKARIRLVTDPKQNLRSVEGLDKGISITGESQLLEGLLSVLAKNGLSEVLESPRIQAVNGQVATFRVDSDQTDPPRRIELELLNWHSGKQVVFEARASVRLGEHKREIDTAFALTKGQAFLMRIAKGEKASDSEDLYLLVCRE